MDYFYYLGAVVVVAAVAYVYWSNHETSTPVSSAKNPVPVVKGTDDKKVDSVPEKVNVPEKNEDVKKNDLEKDHAIK